MKPKDSARLAREAVMGNTRGIREDAVAELRRIIDEQAAEIARLETQSENQARIIDTQRRLFFAGTKLPSNAQALVDSACAFAVFTPADPRRPIRIERTDATADTWAVRFYGECANRDGEWEYEPMPSSRDDAFLARTRFTRDEAIAIARDLAAKEKEPT